MRGYIKLYRKIKEKPWWKRQRFTWTQAWIDLLLRVNHKDAEVTFDNGNHKIPRGSFITSQRQLAEDWRWGIGRVNNFLSFLKKRECSIDYKTEHNFTHIFILNWDKYQGGLEHKAEHKAEHDRNKNGTGTETNDNDKNDNNDEEVSKESEQGSRDFQGREDLNVIYLYARFKKVDLISSPERRESFIKRNLRPAQSLKGSPLEKIEKVMEWLENNMEKGFKWSLETVGKYIDEPDLSKLEKPKRILKIR